MILGKGGLTAAKPRGLRSWRSLAGSASVLTGREREGEVFAGGGRLRGAFLKVASRR